MADRQRQDYEVAVKATREVVRDNFPSRAHAVQWINRVIKPGSRSVYAGWKLGDFTVSRTKEK